MDANTANEFCEIIRETAIDGELERLLKNWSEMTPELRAEIVHTIRDLITLESALKDHSTYMTSKNPPQ